MCRNRQGDSEEGIQGTDDGMCEGVELGIFTSLWGPRKGPSAQVAETRAGGKLIAMSQEHQTLGAGLWLVC